MSDVSASARTPVNGMNCPICNISLVIAERQGVEIDYCPNCRGVWLDRGELDKIIERNAADQSYAAAPPPQQQQQYYGRDEGHGGGHRGGHGGGHGAGHGAGHGGHRGRRGFLGSLFD